MRLKYSEVSIIYNQKFLRQFGGKAKLVVTNVANLQNHQVDGGRERHGPAGGPAAHAGQSEYPGSQAPQTGQPNIHSSEFSFGRKEGPFGNKKKFSLWQYLCNELFQNTRNSAYRTIT
jgi:hypothetical protein